MRALLALLILLAPGAARAQQFFGTNAPGGSGSSVTATGSTTARTAGDRAAETLNVMDYGAKCDNTTDDTAAINATLDQARALVALSARSAVSIALPRSIPGVFRRCVVSGTLNFTGFIGGTVNGVTFEGNGTTILSNVVGAPVVDALGSNHIHWNDLKIQANLAATYGIQIGRTLPTGTDYGGGAGMVFTNPDISGVFTAAAFYNFASEEVFFYNPHFATSYASATAYGYVADGFNHFNITSAFVTETAPVDTAQSFEENVFIGGSIAAVGTGAISPVWLGAVTQHRFIDTYFLNLTGTSCVQLYNAAAGAYSGIKGLDLDIHCEAAGLTSIILINGTLAAPVIHDLTFREVYEFSTGSVFKLGGSATSATLEHPFVYISGGPTSPTWTMFDTPTNYTTTGGEFYVYDTAPWKPPGNLLSDVTLPGRNQKNAAQMCASTQAVGGAGLRGPQSNVHCTTTLVGHTSVATGLRLTTNEAAAGASNCINVPTDFFGSLTGMTIDVVARDRVIVTNTVAWLGYPVVMSAPSSLLSITVTAGTKPTPISTGTVTGTDITVSADTTNGCLNLTWTPPTSNTDLWDVSASVTFSQVR